MSTPDIMDALRAHLADELGVPVYLQMPSTRPDVFLYLDRSGGTGKLSSDTATVTFEAWASSKMRAYTLAQNARDHMIRHLPPTVGGIRVVRRREYAGPSYQPPTVSGAFRYRWTVEVKHQLMIEEESA